MSGSTLQGTNPVAAVFEIPPSHIESYDRALDHAGGRLRNQPGRRQHVCFQTDTGYMVVDVWESLEAFERFGEVLDAVVKEIPAPVRVKLHRVHNVM